uniref:Uncharacterized protein n=1 Tax=Alexandrium monilatum TaxID=311494 RepID=A0A7S4QRU3_9DINO
MSSETPAPQYVEDFFQHCFGFNEKSILYAEVQERFAVEDDGFTLVAKENGRRFQAGHFSCPSLGSLREQAREAAKQESAAGASPDPSAPPLTVRHVVTSDALADHADPQHRGALFQVASQFNCLEFTSMKRTPEDGIRGYAHDRTQGPACAIACAPATVFRNYFVPVSRGEGKGPQIGQTAELQINSLDGIEALLGNQESPPAQVEGESKARYFFVENGYVCSETERLAKLKAKLEEMGPAGKDDLRAALRVGFAQGSEVVFKAFVPFEGLLPLPPPADGDAVERQEVSQIFCAAAKVNTSFANPSDWESFARLLLEATYEASLWAGVVNMFAARRKAQAKGVPPPPGCHRVMLTLVGGGVFGNELDWIVEALNQAIATVASAAPPGGWGLEVCLTHFQSINPALEKAVYLGAPIGSWGS